jgi:uracil DNA glycosylase
MKSMKEKKSVLSRFVHDQGDINELCVLLKKIQKSLGEYCPETYLKTFCVANPPLKCVWIGNAPYEGKGDIQPTGIPFQTKDNVPSKTLRRFATAMELEKDEIPDVERMSDECGFLMVNASLTVSTRNRKPQYSVWHQFICILLACLYEEYPQCLFVFWGAKARALLDDEMLQKMANNERLNSSCKDGVKRVYKCHHPIGASKDELKKMMDILRASGIDWCSVKSKGVV